VPETRTLLLERDGNRLIVTPEASLCWLPPGRAIGQFVEHLSDVSRELRFHHAHRIFQPMKGGE
jgi:hypothetical protein